jgi:hypothetical protein
MRTVRVSTVTSLLLSVLAQVAHAGAEYGIAVSASHTDPNVNYVAAPGPGVFPLYLWLTCAAGPVASLGAEVATDFSVTSFTPDNGVQNFGTPTELRLAIPSCPDSSLVLGHWDVAAADSSGQLCLHFPTGSPPRCALAACWVLGRMEREAGVRGFAVGDSIPCVSNEWCR